MSAHGDRGRASAGPGAGRTLDETLTQRELADAATVARLRNAASVLAQRRSHAGGVVGIDELELLELTFDDFRRYALHGTGDVAVEPLLLGLVEQPVQGARLRIIVVALAMVVPVGVAGDFQRRFGHVGALGGTSKRIRLVVGVRVRSVGLESHGTVLVVVVHGAARCVDWQRFIVCSQAVAVCIGVGEDTRLQHFVGRKADPWHDV